ncbi:unnamed protein product [Rotaria sp. Silwood2]|nr:unnamed protein product [Rotaria sp. Silwood2]
MSQLQQLLLSTPILTKLDVQLIADTTPADITFLPPTITTEILQLKNKIAEKSNITFNDITVLFAWMPKLNKFTFIAAKGVKFIRGEQWEYRIRTYLSQLKEFHFKTHPHLYDTNIEQLLAIFQTSFWLKEHQWFVNCDHHHLPYIGYLNPRNVHLYTLPYSDEQFYLSLSTKNINKQKHYHFPNLESLTICNLHKLISIDNLINLSQIKHLTIKQNNPIHSEEFLSYILVHSTKLQSLTLSWHTLIEIPKKFYSSTSMFIVE